MLIQRVYAPQASKYPALVYSTRDPQTETGMYYSSDSAPSPPSRNARRKTSVLMSIDNDVAAIVRAKEQMLLSMEVGTEAKALRGSEATARKLWREGRKVLEQLRDRPGWQLVLCQVSDSPSLPASVREQVKKVEDEMKRLLFQDETPGSEREPEREAAASPAENTHQPEPETMTVTSTRSRQGALSRTAAHIKRLQELDARHATLLKARDDEVERQDDLMMKIVGIRMVMEEMNELIEAARRRGDAEVEQATAVTVTEEGGEDEDDDADELGITVVV